MKISKAPIVQCKKCKKKYDINVENFDTPEINTEDRNMGYELQYLWEYEFECEKCKNLISITIEAYEYPEGFFNYDEIDTSGCNLLEKPSFEIEETDREDEEAF